MDKIPRPEIAIVGLGYVGLTLSLQFAHSGVAVPGLDIDSDKVNALNRGRSYIKHIPAEAVCGAGEDTSTSYRIMDLLKQRGAEVAYYDPVRPNNSPDP
jgi:UDP-N-acetyl-D-glucosamine dehydrogenase